MIERRCAAYAGVLCALVAATTGAVHAQWPQFRGPNGSGVDATPGYPIAFSPTRNVAWKVSVPYGQSSPVVVGGRIYLTASDGDRLLTIALDAASGKEQWRREIKPASRHKVYKANDPASPTPAADADGVVAFFPDMGLVAYAADGKEQWTVQLGPFKSFYGMAASPILAGDLAVLVCDQQTGSFVIAVDRKTGQQRWRQERPRAVDGYATPMLYKPASGPAQLIVIGSSRLDSYALDSGENRWWLPIGSSGAMGTAVASGDTIYVATSGSTEPWLPVWEEILKKSDADKDGRISRQETPKDDTFVNEKEWTVMRAYGNGEFGAIAVRPGDARGQLPPSAVTWRFTKNLPYIPAPLLYKDVFYLVKDGGIITALDAATGKLLKQGRTDKALGEYYASPVAADNKVFLASRDGKVTVLKAGAQWQVLGVNDLGEEVHATPALSGGRVYLRTRSSLYSFGVR
jgi:outer membrane protein assembly factor BamB